MTLSDRDRRAVIFLGLSVGASIIFYFASSSGGGSAVSTSTKSAQPVESVERAEQRLQMLRTIAATLPATEEIHNKVAGELAEREKGLIQGDTAAQAQARLVQILRDVAKVQNPPLEIGQTELGQAHSFGDSYGEVSVSINMNCRTDQLVNYIAFLSAQPELIATDEIRFAAGHPKTKAIPVRLTVTALVPRKLIPQKKGTTF